MGVHRCCAADPMVKTELREDLKLELADIPNEERLAESGKVLGALSHPTRLKMAFLLLKRDHCVCELVELTNKRRNLVSHHLSVMRRNQLVKPYRKSNLKYYRLNKSAAHVLSGVETASVSMAC